MQDSHRKKIDEALVVMSSSTDIEFQIWAAMNAKMNEIFNSLEIANERMEREISGEFFLHSFQ